MPTTPSTYHIPVLTKEVIAYLALKPHGVYVDATFGGGGHTRALLQAEPTCKVIAFDWDKQALELNGPPLEEEFGDRLTLIWGNFAQITQLLKKRKIGRVNGILADFGTSQFQLAEREGFSFTIDSPLDMRMSPGHHKTTAYDVVNRAPESELATILYTYGEEERSRAVARAIVASRKEHGPIRTTRQLASVIERVIPPYSRKIHPATKVFQALRIFVNDELNNIKSLLTQAGDVLEDYGRLVCISFHSLEDRLVKQFLREHQDIFTILTRTVVTASEEERAINPSSRSAKLRAAERKERPRS
jgi:16S rRNA (cytosine1402-N4)-methyltransferase